VSFTAEKAGQREFKNENFKRLEDGNGTDLDYSRRILLNRSFRLVERRAIIDVGGTNDDNLSAIFDKAQSPYSTNEKGDSRKEGGGDIDKLPLACIGESVQTRKFKMRKNHLY